MVTIVGIQFQKNGTLYYYDVNQLETRVGDYVIVETVHGPDLGEVVVGCREVEDDKTPAQIKRLIRIATQQDIQHSVENREKEKEAYIICQKKIGEHKLEMKLVSVEYAFDNSKILFYFTANGRIDFRSLVKDLASVFKTRIELRQIGVRDEARMLGGLGQCGRPICCGAFLDEFQPVSIKMAKEQNLSLNPTKISGVCGRLMCCLKYEQEQYEQIRKRMPRVGREIKTPEGFGTVSELNILKETVTVRFNRGDSIETKVFSLDDLSKPGEASEQAQERFVTQEKPMPDIPDEETDDEEIIRDPEQQKMIEPEKPKGRKDKDHRGRNQSGQNRTDSSPEKSPDKPKNTKLGQPVRRENPNRQPVREQEPPARKVENKPTTQPPKKPNAGQWAADLERAMQAIDKT